MRINIYYYGDMEGKNKIARFLHPFLM